MLDLTNCKTLNINSWSQSCIPNTLLAILELHINRPIDMTTLIIGGTGRTGSSLAQLLHDAKRPVLIASRTGQPPTGTSFKAVKFDWFDTATYQNPFAVELGLEKAVDRVYLIPPAGRADAIPTVKSFIDLARSKGVNRYVLLSGSSIKAEDIPFGGVHKHLIDTGVDYTVLRPTWFTRRSWICARGKYIWYSDREPWPELFDKYQRTQSHFLGGARWEDTFHLNGRHRTSGFRGPDSWEESKQRYSSFRTRAFDLWRGMIPLVL